MTPTTPSAVQKKLKHTLAQWRQWRLDTTIHKTPDIEGVLSQGHSNFSFLVSADKRYVVRIDGINPSAHGLNRQTEMHILAEASSAGLSPCPRYFNPDLGALVCDYLAPDENQNRSPEEVGHLLRDIHKLEARHHRLDLHERITRYANKIQKNRTGVTASLEQYRKPVLSLLNLVSSNDSALVLCHNDLLQANRLAHGNRLWALDWEYSAMGSPWYDLASVIEGDQANDEVAMKILRAYLNREASTIELERLNQYRTIYRYLEILWYATTEGSVPATNEIEAKIVLLQKRLNLSPGNY